MMTLVKDYAEQIRGVSYKPEDVCEELNDESITLLRANNITDSGLCFDDLVYVRRNKVKDVQKLQKGDVLICTSSGSKALVGKAAYVTKDMDMTFGAFCKVIRPHGVNTDYFQYFFQSPAYRKKISELAAGANINNIRNEHIDGLAFYLPDISTQQRIADTLDKVSEGIGLCRKMLGELDLMVKAKFVEMFGDAKVNPFDWVQSTIGASCALKSGTSLPIEKENECGNIPYVKVGDMNYVGNEKYITTSSRFVTEETAGGGIFPVGSVVFPKRGGAIGTNKKRLTSVPICADLNVMGVIPGKQLLPQYLLAYFDTIDLGLLNNGSSVPQINNKDIAPLIISIPPIELQEQFATFVSKIDKSRLTIQQVLSKMEMVKLALMQEYFG